MNNYYIPELSWLKEAKKHIGLKEIPGKASNPTIINWLIQLKAWWKEDSTAWCGVFVAHCLKETNRPIPKHWYRAKAYLKYGNKIYKPAYGCLVIFSRKGGGHIGFCVGKDSQGNLLILGGNQSDAVNIKKFSTKHVVGYRWIPRPDGKLLFPYSRRYLMTSDDSKIEQANKVV